MSLVNSEKLLPSRLCDSLANRLRERIQTGEMNVGSKLPAQRELAASFGVSRQTIQDALMILEEELLIEIRLGATGGSFVTIPQFNKRDVQRWAQSRLWDLDEICDFRIAIEKQIAILAAERRTEDDLSKMLLAIEDLPTNGTSRFEFREADGRFHAAVASAARNSRLESALRKSRSELFIPADTIEFTEEVEATRAQHFDIYREIANRNGQAAGYLVVAHIEDTRKMIRALLSKTG
jgi:GntR family transcriptional regulator, transcriptional repressor for pyruvate dehydrogenase complex